MEFTCHPLKTKLRIFNSNVKSIQSSETWTNTKSSSNQLQTFINRCLRRILKISWAERITNMKISESKQVRKPFKYKSDVANGVALVTL